MEVRKIKRLRTILTVHFAVIACLTSVLVANSGNGNLFLPALVLLVVTSSLILVDWLEVFYIGQIGSYVAMSIATLVALITLGVSVVQSSEQGQFMAVASLLIYPQCVLFFQKKSLRVFEQLAIFLLLQMIVAALINDNLLYGLMLTPILMLWVSSLFLFSRYASLVEITPGIEHPVPLLYELIYQKFVKSVTRQTPTRTLVTTHAVIDPVILSTRKKRALFLALPLSLTALAFAGTLFYLLPRTEGGGVAGWDIKQIGLPDQITTGSFGRILSNPTPVMRLRFLTSAGAPYQPVDPPYLRVGVLDKYIPPRRVYDPGHWVYQSPSRPRDSYSYNGNLKGRELIKVEVSLKKSFRKMVVSVPPILAVPEQMRYKAPEMVLLESDQISEAGKKKILSYQFDSVAFADRRQVSIIPDYHRSDPYGIHMQIPPMRLANQKRIQILRSSGVAASQPYQVAKALERHLKLSGEYSYTLDVPRPINEDIDPIEDFIINLKTGLCQSYAAALVTMLRQSEIPSRIVIGFMPVQWNKLGQHFIVRQSDAHAWVEARFSREELRGTELASWLDDAPYYWVRLDPTPSVDDDQREIVESNQSLEYAEKLWEDYVSNADKMDQAGLYEGVTLSGKDLLSNIQAAFFLVKTRLSEGWFEGRRIQFAWPIALAVFLLGAIAILGWQLATWLPRFAPGLARRMGLSRKKRTVVQQAFYARCIRMLESLRLFRNDSETMQEYNERARQHIESRSGLLGSQELDRSLNYLRSMYHRLRFGADSSLDPAARSEIEDHLRTVEEVVQTAKIQR
jgi:protein-glutamine gamma-glutamyltransferase